MAFERPDDHRRGPESEAQEADYEKAMPIAERVAKAVDPAYDVRISRVVVTPDDPSRGEYSTWALKFTSIRRPQWAWTMEIIPTDDYIQREMPEVIRQRLLQEQAD